MFNPNVVSDQPQRPSIQERVLDGELVHLGNYRTSGDRTVLLEAQDKYAGIGYVVTGRPYDRERKIVYEIDAVPDAREMGVYVDKGDFILNNPAGSFEEYLEAYDLTDFVQP